MENKFDGEWLMHLMSKQETHIRGKKVRDILVCYVISMNPSELIM